MTDSLLVSVRAEEFLARMTTAPDRLRANLERVVQRLSIKAQTIVKQKLTGPVLHNRSGTLRRSINREVVSDSHGVVATVGTNVKYAAPHEYGFDGVVSVKAHARMAVSATTSAKAAKRKLGYEAAEKASPGSVVHVRAHSRHVRLPERSFLRSTVREMSEEITRDVKAAALAALL